MLSSVTDCVGDTDTASLDALRPENIAKNRVTNIIPRMYTVHYSGLLLLASLKSLLVVIICRQVLLHQCFDAVGWALGYVKEISLENVGSHSLLDTKLA